MTTQEAAMRKALEALEGCAAYTALLDDFTQEACREAIESLRTALAQQGEQKPVAWAYWQSCLNDDGTQTAPWVHRFSKSKPSESIINKDITPLYTAAPAAQQGEQPAQDHSEQHLDMVDLARKAYPHGEPNWLSTSEESKNLHDAECAFIRAALQSAQPVAAVPLPEDQIAKYELKAVHICQEAGRVSVSMVQRRLNIGYDMATRLCQHLVDSGFVPGLPLAPSLQHGIKESKNE